MRHAALGYQRIDLLPVCAVDANYDGSRAIALDVRAAGGEAGCGAQKHRRPVDKAHRRNIHRQLVAGARGGFSLRQMGLAVALLLPRSDHRERIFGLLLELRAGCERRPWAGTAGPHVAVGPKASVRVEASGIQTPDLWNVLGGSPQGRQTVSTFSGNPWIPLTRVKIPQ